MNFEKLRILDQSILDHYPCKDSFVNRKVAIIGNSGATPQDNEKLSEADVVIRFNNYATRQGIKSTQDPFQCDILFTTTDLHSHGSRPKDVVIGIPSPFKQDQVIRNLTKWYPDARLWMVNPYTNYLLCKELDLNSDGSKHPLPSIGFTALWHMRNWSCNQYIGGFEWYCDPEKQTVQNRHITLKNLPSNFNHFYMKELNWIIKNFKPKKNILFSDRCQKILSLVESKL